MMSYYHFCYFHHKIKQKSVKKYSKKKCLLYRPNREIPSCFIVWDDIVSHTNDQTRHDLFFIYTESVEVFSGVRRIFAFLISIRIDGTR